MEEFLVTETKKRAINSLTDDEKPDAVSRLLFISILINDTSNEIII
jgi:hypothetical protein